jgi:hypothetical protein
VTAPARFRPLPALAEARTERVPGLRLELLRRAAQAAREAFVREGPVEALATVPLVTFPYPTRFAFSGGAHALSPYVMMTNRMQVVQFREAGGGPLRTLLFNPSDYERGVLAPFYGKLRERYGDFLSQRVMSTRHGSVQGHLEALGLRPEDVDYLAFDHLHIQDLRRWLGDGETPGLFPRAQLLCPRAEWECVQHLHPMQRVWYVPDGAQGVSPERVVLLDGDAWLGAGVALLMTPGHTVGNMSLVVATREDVFVVSENGVATESYTPERSHIPGVRAFAEQLGLEVVLNGNTRESSLDQYSSMLVEKQLAGASRVDGGYVNFYPSSELTASLLSPGLSPTLSLPPPMHGQVRRPEA